MILRIPRAGELWHAYYKEKRYCHSVDSQHITMEYVGNMITSMYKHKISELLTLFTTAAWRPADK